MTHPKKIRIDRLLVQRALVDSRESAQRLILAGEVRIGDQPAQKPGQMVPEDAEIEVLQALKYVSRGGYKLEKALDEFGVTVNDRIVLDIGVSTGGFTDCLLQRGARRVYAVDVGYGQIAWKLRNDPRVVLRERTNARSLARNDFPEPVDLAVIDVSFIGSYKILEPLRDITGEVLLLFKPQFEAGPQDVPRGGVLRDARLHEKVLLHFFESLEAWYVYGLTESPILGGSGNREFLVHLKTQPPGWSEENYRQRVTQLVEGD